MNETPKNPVPPEDSAENPDATDTAVQPAAPAAGSGTAPQQAAPGPVAEAAPKKNRFGWVSSPKVAAATVITVLALSSLGGAFALGRATAPDHDDRMMIRVPGGFEGPQGFDGQRGFGFREGGPGLRHRFGEGELEQAPAPDGSDDGEVTPAPSQSS